MLLIAKQQTERKQPGWTDSTLKGNKNPPAERETDAAQNSHNSK